MWILAYSEIRSNRQSTQSQSTHFLPDLGERDRERRHAPFDPCFLSDGQLIFFNSSSTLAYILPYLADYKNIRVVTNSVYLLSLLAQMHVPVSVTGGRYDEHEQSLSGRQAEAFLSEINPDIAFLSCEALSDDGRVTDSDEDLAEIAKIAVKKSRVSVMLMDRSKIGTTCAYDVCTTDQLDGVILV